jgi:hypothetical protein
VAATTFDPAHTTNTALSGGNLIATSSGAGGTYSSRMAQGPFYFECTPTTLTGTPSIGLACAWNTSTALQSATNTLAYLASGAVQVNGVTLATIAAWAQGNRIDCACDPANRLIWFRVAGGNWNNNAANNPAIGTQTGGIDISSMALGTIAAAIYASATGNVWSAAFSAASWAGAAPSGYSSPDAIQYTVARNIVLPYEANPISAQTLGPAARAFPNGQDKYEAAFSPAGPMTYVSGQVQESGVPVAGKWVEVCDRDTGDRLGRVKSDGSGNWQIACLGRVSVVAFCLDPAFNALIFDNIVPL